MMVCISLREPYTKNVWREKNLKEPKIIHSLKTYGIKGFFKKWKEGFSLIPPESLIKTRIWSTFGMIGALLLGIVFTLLKGTWYLSLIFVFVIIIQATVIIGDYQQYKNLTQFKEVGK